MIIPWQDIAPETLTNLIEQFILREGTDYGEVEISLVIKSLMFVVNCKLVMR